ncbi:MAG: NAD regulator, partial [Henriciella sp.]
MSAASVIIGLSVVIVAADGDTPCVLVTRRQGDLAALPFGTFDPATHRTFELALRGWVREQTGFDLGYVEQLYTFGDRDRETPEATLADAPENTRVVSVGYLGLTPDQQRLPERLEAKWRGWYSHFPWEDHRAGRPALIDAEIAPRLNTWAAGNDARQARDNLA